MNILASTFIAFSLLVNAPNPTPNFGVSTGISPQTVNKIAEAVLNNEYYFHLDFNGDLELDLADVVSVQKRYESNKNYNCLTVDSELIEELFETNEVDVTNWSFEGTDSDYVEVDVNSIVQVNFTTTNGGGYCEIFINPTAETIQITDFQIEG